MEVKIIKYDDLGQGICFINDKICFVKYGVPSDLLNIKIIKDKSKYSTGEIIDIIKSSNNRIKPVCNYYYECGGCNFLHVKENEEIEFKKQKCINYFNKLDNFYLTKNNNYRNKVVLHVKNGNIGFYKEKTNDLTSINYCYLLNNRINDIIKILNLYKDINFNGKIIIRVNSLNEIILVVDGDYKYLDKLIDIDIINNIIYNNKIIKGNDYFIEYIDNYKFIVNYNSFFQVNIDGLNKIIDILKEYLSNKNIDKVLDLYSGISILGIIISKYVNEVVCIESNKNASLDALKNIKLNNLNNIKVINGLVEDYVDLFKEMDLIIVDPTRYGLDKKTISYLKDSNVKYIIYIACGIDALKRDLNILKDKYELINLNVVDMFPRTNHCESICLLERK